MRQFINCRRGTVLVVTLVTLLVVMLVAATVLRSLLASRRLLATRQYALQAEWLAESAVSRAVAQLTRDNSYTGETWTVSTEKHSASPEPPAGVSEIQIQKLESPPNRVRITVKARFPDHETRRALVQREYFVAIPPARDPRGSQENQP